MRRQLVQASSGKTVRHRLNRGGDRQANNALWVIAFTRLRGDPATRAYADRRTKQGKTTKEILRCLIGRSIRRATRDGVELCSWRGSEDGPMSCQQMASLSCAAAGRAEPRPASGSCPVEGRQ